jgi:hypothetical protein
MDSGLLKIAPTVRPYHRPLPNDLVVNIDDGVGGFLFTHMLREFNTMLINGSIFVSDRFVSAPDGMTMRYEIEGLALSFDLGADVGDFT